MANTKNSKRKANYSTPKQSVTPKKSLSRKQSDTTDSVSTVAEKNKKIRQPYTYFVGNNPYKMSVKLKKEISHFPNIVSNLIPKLPFCRMIREILEECGQDYRVQPEALEGIQIAAEMYLTQLFEDSNRCAGHAKRVTLKGSDMDLVRFCPQSYDPISADI